MWWCEFFHLTLGKRANHSISQMSNYSFKSVSLWKVSKSVSLPRSSPLPRCLWSRYTVAQLCDQPSADRCHRAAQTAVLLRPRSGLSFSEKQLAPGPAARLLGGWDEQSCRQRCCSWTWPHTGHHLSRHDIIHGEQTHDAAQHFGDEK